MRGHRDHHGKPDGADTRSDQVDLSCRRSREIDYATGHERSPVVDSHPDALSIVKARDLHDRSERKLPVGGGQEGGIVDLPGSRRLSVKPVLPSVPGGETLLCPIGGWRLLRDEPRRRRPRRAGRRRAECSENENETERGPGFQTFRGTAWAASRFSRAGSSSSRTKASTCSAARPTRRSGREASTNSSRVR